VQGCGVAAGDDGGAAASCRVDGAQTGSRGGGLALACRLLRRRLHRVHGGVAWRRPDPGLHALVAACRLVHRGGRAVTATVMWQGWRHGGAHDVMVVAAATCMAGGAQGGLRGGGLALAWRLSLERLVQRGGGNKDVSGIM
jgi:hypothetical protein